MSAGGGGRRALDASIYMCICIRALCSGAKSVPLTISLFVQCLTLGMSSCVFRHDWFVCGVYDMLGVAIRHVALRGPTVGRAQLRSLRSTLGLVGIGVSLGYWASESVVCVCEQLFFVISRKRVPLGSRSGVWCRIWSEGG